jgi:viroplasmin and RNaseH domain-containing protein
VKGNSTGPKWYYAVVRGQIPGVYTKWGDAEKQVNGFSGSLHQKHRDHKGAQKFVDKHCPQKEDESASESKGTDPGSDGGRLDAEDAQAAAKQQMRMHKSPRTATLHETAGFPQSL